MFDCNKCICVPDDDPRLKRAKQGETQLTNGILYVRESDWLQFLALIAKHKGGEEMRSAFLRATTH